MVKLVSPISKALYVKLWPSPTHISQSYTSNSPLVFTSTSSHSGYNSGCNRASQSRLQVGTGGSGSGTGQVPKSY